MTFGHVLIRTVYTEHARILTHVCRLSSLAQLGLTRYVPGQQSVQDTYTW